VEGVLVGFAVIAVIIAAGFVAVRTGVVAPGAERMLGRLAFFILTPALLFGVIARADIPVLFTALLPVSAISAAVVMAIYAAIALVAWRRKVPETVIGSLGAGLVNANNIGLPISLYVLGDAATSASIMMFQLVVLTPIALTILDLTTGRRERAWVVILKPLWNPLIIASVLGLIVALTGIRLPDAVYAPFDMIGAAAVPIVLLAYGMSLNGARVLSPGTSRRDVVVASILKLAVMPAVAWVLARFVFGLEGHALFAAVVLAGLPAAQNVFVFAQRYDRGVVLARDIVLITTLASLPLLLGVAALLAA
jgi:predicted permease